MSAAGVSMSCLGCGGVAERRFPAVRISETPRAPHSGHGRCCPTSSRRRLARDVALRVDPELALVVAADAPVLDPLLGDLVQDPVLLLPVHEVPRAIDREAKLVVILHQTIK